MFFSFTALGLLEMCADLFADPDADLNNLGKQMLMKQ